VRGFGPGLALGVILGTLNLAAVSNHASAETWRVDPTLSVDATLTNNVDLAPSGARQSDFYTQISPGFNVIGSGSHARISGSVSVPMLLYARTGAENNSVYPQVSLIGNAELIDRFLCPLPKVQNLFGIVAENPAGRRQGDPCSQAFKERRIQFLLQLAHLGTDRRLGPVACLRRLGEAFQPDDLQKRM